MLPQPPYFGATPRGRIPEWLRRRAQISPDRLAVTDGELSYTFAELDRAVDRAAARLAALGIGAGRHVALAAGNSARYAVAVFALARLGAVLLPLNVRLTPAELSFQLEEGDASFLLYDAERAPVADSLGFDPRARLEEVAAGGDGAAGAGDFTRTAPGEGPGRDGCAREFDLDAVQCIMFTSGTTGRPKGAMLTFGNHWWSAIGSALNLGLQESDAWLAAVPLFHVSGLSILWRSVIYGISAVIHPKFDPDAVNRAIDRGEVTLLSLVAAMLQRLLDARGQAPFPPTVRAALAGGGPVPRYLLQRAEQLGLPVLQTYGLTETASQVATLSPRDARRKPGSAGKALFPVEVTVDSPPGGEGEILVRGPVVMAGYYKRPEATREALRGGWLHTGDIGRLDDEGFLYVSGRRSDLIISGGENVYPAEVEAALASHPAVAEAGVIGAADPEWGEVPVALVALRPGANVEAADLQAFCRGLLAPYKIPRRVRFVEALPRNAAGKLIRTQLKEVWQRAGGAETPEEGAVT